MDKQQEFTWDDELVLDFHESFMGSESENIYDYMYHFKKSKVEQSKHERTYTKSEVDAIREKIWNTVIKIHPDLDPFKKYDNNINSLNDNKQSTGKSQKDYKILSYINPNVQTDIEGGNIVNAKDCASAGIAIIRNYPINSVKRLSDNTVFSVGDEVKFKDAHYGSFIITNFFMIGDGILARSEGNNYCEYIDSDLLKLPSKEQDGDDVVNAIYNLAIEDACNVIKKSVVNSIAEPLVKKLSKLKK